ncbi:hypothetical protein BDC45DRAFT_105046 [Circinella umbellata]|nr:hypothetical protein BDC45DRAFT_105046 [Circinella umbellata]
MYHYPILVPSMSREQDDNCFFFFVAHYYMFIYSLQKIFGSRTVEARSYNIIRGKKNKKRFNLPLFLKRNYILTTSNMYLYYDAINNFNCSTTVIISLFSGIFFSF